MKVAERGPLTLEITNVGEGRYDFFVGLVCVAQIVPVANSSTVDLLYGDGRYRQFTRRQFPALADAVLAVERALLKIDPLP